MVASEGGKLCGKEAQGIGELHIETGGCAQASLNCLSLSAGGHRKNAQSSAVKMQLPMSRKSKQ